MNRRGICVRVGVALLAAGVVAAPRAIAADEVEYGWELFRAGYYDLAIEELIEVKDRPTTPEETRRHAMNTLQSVYGSLMNHPAVPTELKAQYRKDLQELEQEIEGAGGDPVTVALAMRDSAVARWKSVVPHPPEDMSPEEAEETKQAARAKIEAAIEKLAAYREEGKKALVAAHAAGVPEDKIGDLEAQHAVAWVFWDETRFHYADVFLKGDERKKLFEEVVASYGEYEWDYSGFLVSLRGKYFLGRIYEARGEMRQATAAFDQILSAKVEAGFDPDQVTFLMNLKREVYARGIEAALKAQSWDSVITNVNNLFAEFPALRQEVQGRNMLFVKYEAMVNRGDEASAREVYDEVRPLLDTEDPDEEYWKQRAWTIVGKIGILHPQIVPKEMVYRGANAYFNRNQYVQAADAFQNLLGGLADQQEFERYGPELYSRIAECYQKLGRRMEEGFVSWQASRLFHYFLTLRAQDPLPKHLQGFFQTMMEARSFPARMALEASKIFGAYAKRTNNPLFAGLKQKVDDEIRQYFSEFPEVAASRFYEEADELRRKNQYVTAALKFASISPEMGEYFQRAQHMPGECYFFQGYYGDRGAIAAGQSLITAEEELFSRIRAEADQEAAFAFVPEERRAALLGWLNRPGTEYRDRPVLAHYAKARFFYSRYFYWLYADDERELQAELARLAGPDWLIELAASGKREALVKTEQEYLEVLRARDLDRAAELQPRVALARMAAYEAGAVGENAENVRQYNRLKTEIERRFQRAAVARYYLAQTIFELARPLRDAMKEASPDSPRFAELQERYVAENQAILVEINDYWEKYGKFLGENHKLRPAIIKAEFTAYLYLASVGRDRPKERAYQALRALDDYEKLFAGGPDAKPEEREWVQQQRIVVLKQLDIENYGPAMELVKNKINPLQIARQKVRQGFNSLQELMDLVGVQAGEPETAAAIGAFADRHQLSRTDAVKLLPDQIEELDGLIEAARARYFAQYVALENETLRGLMQELDQQIRAGTAELKRLQGMADRLVLVNRYRDAAKYLELGHRNDPLAARGVTTPHPPFDQDDRSNIDEFLLKMKFVDCYWAIGEDLIAQERRKQGGKLGVKKYPDDWRENWQKLSDQLDRLQYLIKMRDDYKERGAVVKYEREAGAYYIIVLSRKAEANWMLALDEQVADRERLLREAAILFVDLRSKVEKYSTAWWELCYKWGAVAKLRGDQDLEKYVKNLQASDEKMGGFRDRFEELLKP